MINLNHNVNSGVWLWLWLAGGGRWVVGGGVEDASLRSLVADYTTYTVNMSLVAPPLGWVIIYLLL